MHRCMLLALVTACAFHGPDTTPDTPVTPAAAPRARTYAHPISVDHMLRGYFYAGSPKSEGLGGYATSDNMPRPLSDLKDVASNGDGLRVLALVDQDRPFHQHDGFRVIVANGSDDDLVFAAQDSRLEIIHEALDASGTWQPIEYLPHSWCGNSYHQLTLPARSYWEFVAPRYDGEFPTKLRIRVEAGDRDHHQVVYSNEFVGRVHKAQLAG